MNLQYDTTAYGSIKKQLPIIIMGSLSLMASLAWNEAIKSIIDYYYPNTINKDNYMSKVVYAAILSVIIILVIFIITKYFK